MQIGGLKLCKRLLRAQMHYIFDIQLLQEHVLRWGVDETRDYVLKHVCGVAVHTDFVLPTDSCASFWTGTLDSQNKHHNILRMWHNVASSSFGSVDGEQGLHSGVAHRVRFMGIVIAQASEEYCTPAVGHIVEQSHREQANVVVRIQPWAELIVQGVDASQFSSIRGVSCM